jgi:HYR domain-containing protein
MPRGRWIWLSACAVALLLIATGSALANPPVLVGLSSDFSVEATGPQGADVSYALPTATADNPDPTVGCVPGPATTFSLGPTLVTCTATDTVTNESVEGGFTVTVEDTTPPTLAGVPANITKEATAASTPVSYTAPTATDLVDGTVGVSCNHPSGSGFPVATTTVSCSATDAHGNASATKTFTVTVRDTTPPSLNLPSAGPFEATSAGGAAVGFSVTATDLVDPSPTVSCDRSPGAVFPLGASTVTCTAKDVRNNVSAPTSFTITVVDTTPPTLSLPAPASAEATSVAGAAVSFSVTAADVVDPSPTATCDHASGAVFPLGNTTVGCTSTDARGNTSQGTFVVKVKDTVAPPNVANLRAKTGEGSVTLTWTKPQSADFDHAAVFRSRPDAAGLGSQIYNGQASQVRLRGLKNGVTYRFVVASFDRTGNRSRGVAILVRPVFTKLFSPVNGATVARPPLLQWARVKKASYYNVQLFRVTSRAQTRQVSSAALKILSAWPRGTRLALKKTWRFDGKTYRLTPGVYRWFVWPGYGRPAESRYGRLLGQSTFVVER